MPSNVLNLYTNIFLNSPTNIEQFDLMFERITNALSDLHMIPSLPFISIDSFNGTPEGRTNDPHLRVRRLIVHNTSDVEIENFSSRLQFPEPISETLDIQHSIGTAIGWRSLTDIMLIEGNGGRTAGGMWSGGASTNTFINAVSSFSPDFNRGERMTVHNLGDKTGVWELTIDRVPPKDSYPFYSSHLTTPNPKIT